MLDEEMKKLDVSPDRFRQWHTDFGATSFVAKFVSCIDGNVTLEKEDGTQIAVALTDFMQGDQNFIRHCFKMVSNPPEFPPSTGTTISEPQALPPPVVQPPPEKSGSVLLPVLITFAILAVAAFFALKWWR
jgi:hypothetical protein